MTESYNYKIIRTIRCKNINVPGTLGKLTMAIGNIGGDVGNIETVHLGNHYTVRDIDILVESEEQLNRVVEEVSKLKGVNVLQVRDAVLELHENGKIKMINTAPVTTLDLLSKIYTPGVAEVCNLITSHPGWKNFYTIIPYSVAIITDGSAILGLGNIGSVAGMPVIEGKASLLQQFVGINGIPILLDTNES